MKNLFIILFSALIFFSCKSNNDDVKVTDNKASDEIALQKELQKAVKYVSGRDSVDAYLNFHIY